MKTVKINDGFLCVACNAEVPPATGTCRDHCNVCLTSLHVDTLPGDRSADCGGLFLPTHAVLHAKKGITIQYICKSCGKQHQNRAADDDERTVLEQLILAANRRTAGL